MMCAEEAFATYYYYESSSSRRDFAYSWTQKQMAKQHNNIHRAFLSYMQRMLDEEGRSWFTPEDVDALMSITGLPERRVWAVTLSLDSVYPTANCKRYLLLQACSADEDEAMVAAMAHITLALDEKDITTTTTTTTDV
jgi:hypothetical protein